jgi:predicted RNA binding protein with dsRBD fold (UPF0201 family)
VGSAFALPLTFKNKQGLYVVHLFSSQSILCGEIAGNQMAKAFISYSHRDEKALERLHTHLATLRREDTIAAWYVLNKGNRDREAHLTVHADSQEAFGGEISYSFSRRASANTANGFIRIKANEYELYLALDNFSSHRARDGGMLSAEQAAEALWKDFTSRAGIDHE